MDNNFNFQEMYRSMPLYKRVALFLKLNHFVFWKITVMDITIIVPLFLIVAFTLSSCTAMEFPVIFLLDGALCGLILYGRIRYRRVKFYRYVLNKVQQVDRLIQKFTEEVDRTGTEKDKETVARLVEMLEDLKKYVNDAADVAYYEDIIGFRDKDDE